MSQSSSSSAEERAQCWQAETVETVFPSAEAAAQAEEEANGAGHGGSVQASCGSGNTVDVDAIVAKALDELGSELAALAKDPKRHAHSKDPGWKYGFWPYEGKRDMVQCIFCKKIMPAGIKRFKQHLADGSGDAEKCPNAVAEVRKEMSDYLKKNARIQ